MKSVVRERRSPCRVVEQDEVDIARVIELAAAELAHAEDDQTALFRGGRLGGEELVRGGLRSRWPIGRIERRLGEPGQRLHLALEVPGAGDVGDRDHERDAAANDAQPAHELVLRLAGGRVRRLVR